MSDYIVRRRKNRADKVVGELVRCAECKYHYGEYCSRLVSKEAWIVLGSQCVITMQPNDFCSYGERKESQ